MSREERKSRMVDLKFGFRNLKSMKIDYNYL